MSDKTESKQSQVVAHLREHGVNSASNGEVARLFDCNEGTVRRAKKVVEAEQVTDQAVCDGMDTGEAADLLLAILAADDAEIGLAVMIEDVKEELKTLKESFKDAVRKSREVRTAVRERMPLFDAPASGRLSLAHTA